MCKIKKGKNSRTQTFYDNFKGVEDGVKINKFSS